MNIILFMSYKKHVSISHFLNMLLTSSVSQMEETRVRIVDTSCCWCHKSLVKKEHGIVTLCSIFFACVVLKKTATDWWAMPDWVVQITTERKAK